MFVATVTTMSAQPPAPPLEPKPAPHSRRDEDDDDIELPRRRRPYRDNFDDDDDRVDAYDGFHVGRRRGRLPAHRGGIVLALGLVALVGGMSFWLPLVIGPVAWILGMWDLREMREGRMDPDGQGMTQAGMVCGIVATVFLVLVASGIGFCCLAGMH
jgi:hypothetical protein